MMQRMLGPIALALALSLGTLACGGNVAQGEGGAGGTSGGTGGGATQSKATLKSYCEGKVAREQKCDPANAGTVEDCLVDADSTCLFSGFRVDVRDAVVSCLNDRACNTGDDPCYYEPGLANPAAGQAEFISACQAKLASCNGSFGDDICSATTLTAAGYTQLTACLDEACSAVGDCLDAAVAAICPGL